MIIYIHTCGVLAYHVTICEYIVAHYMLINFYKVNINSLKRDGSLYENLAFDFNSNGTCKIRLKLLGRYLRNYTCHSIESLAMIDDYLCCVIVILHLHQKLSLDAIRFVICKSELEYAFLNFALQNDACQDLSCICNFILSIYAIVTHILACNIIIAINYKKMIFFLSFSLIILLKNNSKSCFLNNTA